MRKGVYLKSSHSSIWDWFLESWLFGKTEKFKNNPRVNSMVWPSLIATLTVLLFIGTLALIISGIWLIWIGGCIQGFISVGTTIKSKFCSVTTVVKWIAVPLVSIWYLIFHTKTKTFREQWTYCANLYNKVLELGIKGECQQKLKPLKIALAIDILTLDLWAHRSFRDFFEVILGDACKFEDDRTNNGSAMTVKLHSNQMTEEKTLEILENYQSTF